MPLLSEPKCKSLLQISTDKLCYSLIINRDGGEYPRAFIVRKKNVVTEQELQNLIRERFAPHKWLTAGVFFIDAIPRTGSGKIMRRALPPLPQLNTGGSRSKL